MDILFFNLKMEVKKERENKFKNITSEILFIYFYSDIIVTLINHLFIFINEE